ncbi:c-type cytochrome [Arenibacterium halophilum]|uniref:C-type cytochrome n=1 Tax=Arenibacterium halophilum TaxID=2583821 RepID=A0ABY2XD86_9RHOB|nr:c-type cytochrome [Arenibacterium halophilum]TMV14979.1 c-type cytochrome [Arenibacterium halophilum]
MRGLTTLALLAGLGLGGAAAVVGFGLFNVSAQVGHLPGVTWVLHTTFRNSVSLRAPADDEVPPLSDPDLVSLGAGHYATACAMCHGAPGEPRSATARSMLPAPPPITEAVAHWEANELHWIIQNGAKMTGMPAWPVEKREDEVWAVVAFLVAIKGGTAPDVPSPTLTGTAYCQSCHGDIGGPVPRLDIQPADYLEAQLDAYLTGKRPSGIMAQAATHVPENSFAELAAYFSSKPAAPVPGLVPEEGLGAALAAQGTRDVPACLACHGGQETGKGPRLFGQNEAYLVSQLTLWRNGVLSHDALMAAAARELTDKEITTLSRYFASVGR